MRPILEKLFPILCVSVWGAIPDDLNFDFNPVRDTSDEERSKLIKESADAIVEVFQAGLISQQTALKELRQSGSTFGMWSNITDEDIDSADALPDAKFDELSAAETSLLPTAQPTDEPTLVQQVQQAFEGGAV